jgi:hypothetical protein
MIHFHIRWSDSKLDWEAFQTREEAIAQAKELARPGETYVIAEFDGTCPRCKSLTGLTDRALTGSELSVNRRLRKFAPFVRREPGQ